MGLSPGLSRDLSPVAAATGELDTVDVVAIGDAVSGAAGAGFEPQAARASTAVATAAIRMLDDMAIGVPRFRPLW